PAGSGPNRTLTPSRIRPRFKLIPDSFRRGPMSDDFQVTGNNPAALFTLKVYRGDGMSLLAMNWKTGEPPDDFVGFAIEYKEPGGSKFFALTNRLSFPSDVA